MADLDPSERLARLRSPEVRSQILAEHGNATPRSFARVIHSAYDRMYPVAEVPDYEHTPSDRSLASLQPRAARPTRLCTTYSWTTTANASCTSHS